MLVAIALLVLAGSLAVWVQLNRGGASLALVFVGYSNQTVEVTFVSGQHGYMHMHSARMLVTNNGSVPVQLWNTIRPQSLNAPGFAHGLVSPQVLKPGDSLPIDVSGDFRRPWWTEKAYQPHRLAERLYCWVWHSANPTAQKVISRLMRGPQMVRVESGWITNRPPWLVEFPSWAEGVVASPLSAPSAPSDGWSSNAMSWPLVPSSRRRYHITAPPVVVPISLPPIPPRTPSADLQ